MTRFTQILLCAVAALALVGCNEKQPEQADNASQSDRTFSSHIQQITLAGHRYNVPINFGTTDARSGGSITFLLLTPKLMPTTESERQRFLASKLDGTVFGTVEFLPGQGQFDMAKIMSRDMADAHVSPDNFEPIGDDYYKYVPKSKYAYSLYFKRLPDGTAFFFTCTQKRSDLVRQSCNVRTTWDGNLTAYYFFDDHFITSAESIDRGLQALLKSFRADR